MNRKVGEWTGEIVRHFKGDLYLVIAIGDNTETKMPMVVYKALYDEGKIWIRPFGMFAGKVEVGKENPTGQEFRFELYKPKRKSEYQSGD